jgi:hypothetical protein
MAVTINGTTGIAGVDGSAGTPAVQGADANTGMFFPAADTIAFAEGGTEVGRFDSSANFQFNSGYGSVAVAYGCRAWVNFNGTGTVAIRASGNVTSITDNGVGDYTVNFATAIIDANYLIVSIGADLTTSTLGSIGLRSTSAPTTTAVRVGSSAGDGSAYDQANMHFAIFR